jgi:hypothetical protein
MGYMISFKNSLESVGLTTVSYVCSVSSKKQNKHVASSSVSAEVLPLTRVMRTKNLFFDTDGAVNIVTKNYGIGSEFLLKNDSKVCI